MAARLWSAGRGEVGIARRRMRLLAGAAVAMALALVAAGAAAGEGPLRLASQAAALSSAVLFFVGYAPPSILRTWWRRVEEESIREGELRLLSTSTSSEVLDVLLPLASSLIGARGIAFVDDAGTELATHGDTDDAEPRRIDLASGSLLVFASGYAPRFGEEEMNVLRSVGAVADIALERARVLQLERDARVELERANTELEHFAYAASHDLRRCDHSVRLSRR